MRFLPFGSLSWSWKTILRFEGMTKTDTTSIVCGYTVSAFGSNKRSVCCIPDGVCFTMTRTVKLGQLSWYKRRRKTFPTLWLVVPHWRITIPTQDDDESGINNTPFGHLCCNLPLVLRTTTRTTTLTTATNSNNIGTRPGFPMFVFIPVRRACYNSNTILEDGNRFVPPNIGIHPPSKYSFPTLWWENLHHEVPSVWIFVLELEDHIAI